MKTRQTCEEKIALALDQAISEGFRLGEERGIALGFDMGVEAYAQEVRGER